MEDTLNKTFPVIAIRNSVVFPGLALPLRVGRNKSIAAVKKAKENAQWIIALSQKEGDTPHEPTAADLVRVGTLCKIEKVRGTEEQGFQILIRGVERFRVSELVEKDGYLQARGEEWPDRMDTDVKTRDALLESMKTLSKSILELLPADTSQLVELIHGIADLGYLTHLCAGNLEIPLPKKQELLETVSVKGRVLTLLDLMQTQKDQLEVQGEIRDKLSHKLGKVQRENILREQLKTIREELGDDEKVASDDYRKKIEEAGMPEDVKKVAQDELKRLEGIGSSSPETHVIRNYLDLLCSMPWNKSSSSEIDLDEARKVLDQDHYGLHKIKKRILQHLAVMKLKKNGRGSILLLVGPPGVGKTSLGQSIAKALGRKFVRGSLGGVRDDAEIRGHRRTYIGAMAGRVVQGIKRAGENNPVFMLDEIDKLSRSFQGDPAGALLEVLDPEQNSTFLDHYLDVPFDLSKVFFIATANTLESIPGPLLDRMEVIDLSGYTTAEKLHIAKNHLLPKQLAEHGMSSGELAISDEALMRSITHYTREAGVRELQRTIAAMCRASTEKVIERQAKASPTVTPTGTPTVMPTGTPTVMPTGTPTVMPTGTPTVMPTVTVELSDLEEILGPERFIHEVAERIAPPGVVTGLAWTPQGGEILFIEAGMMPGAGRLTLTGQLGDVMKESAQIALSLVRSKMPLIVPGFEYDKKDVHIHVPAGGIPKDGAFGRYHDAHYDCFAFLGSFGKS